MLQSLLQRTWTRGTPALQSLMFPSISNENSLVMNSVWHMDDGVGSGSRGSSCIITKNGTAIIFRIHHLCGQRNLGVKNWSPTQWRRRSTVANGHASCRQCRREVWDDPSKGYLVEQLHERLTFGRVHGDRLMELFEYWVDNLSAGYRKRLSHEGTVRSTDPIHPRRWWCTARQSWTFDPSNSVYSLVLEIIAPRSVQWNLNTRGDIAEAFLAVAMQPGADVAAREIAGWIERTAGLMYSVYGYFPSLDSEDKLRERLGM